MLLKQSTIAGKTADAPALAKQSTMPLTKLPTSKQDIQPLDAPNPSDPEKDALKKEEAKKKAKSLRDKMSKGKL